MRVNLKEAPSLQTPEGYSYVGMIYDGSASAHLVVSQESGEYAVFHHELPLDFCANQKGVLEAVVTAYDNDARNQEDSVRRIPRTGYMSCKLDVESVVTIREYGHGNFARGARRLTKILRGEVPVPAGFPARTVWMEE